MDEVITLAHGSGGEKSRELVEQLFLPAYANPYLNPLTDSAILSVSEKIAFCYLTWESAAAELRSFWQ